jgi:cytoskeletal protein RodZ
MADKNITSENLAKIKPADFAKKPRNKLKLPLILTSVLAGILLMTTLLFMILFIAKKPSSQDVKDYMTSELKNYTRQMKRLDSQYSQDANGSDSKDSTDTTSSDSADNSDSTSTTDSSTDTTDTSANKNCKTTATGSGNHIKTCVGADGTINAVGY